MVRRASLPTNSGSDVIVQQPSPFLSLELFNPETDDVDSDSSGVSSPDSVDSVISLPTRRPPGPSEGGANASRSPSPPPAPPPSATVPKALIPASPSTRARQQCIFKFPTLDPVPVNRDSAPADGSAASTSAPCDETARRHLADFAEQLSERLLGEIERYRRETAAASSPMPTPPSPPPQPLLNQFSEELAGLSRLTAELQELSRAAEADGDADVVANLARNVGSSTQLLSSLRATPVSPQAPAAAAPGAGPAGSAAGAAPQPPPLVSQLRSGCSVESSDGGDLSDSRRAGTGGGGSTASLGTMESSDAASDCSRDVRFADRRMARCDGRSSSEEAALPPRAPTSRGAPLDTAAAVASVSAASASLSPSASLSASTSQDSLPSDGGAITYHRYYHVFREGELDQLIERYVENLHIISSYYDHTNWCVVAEKVQVWTI